MRYPGGISDVSMIRQGQSRAYDRFAIAQDFTFINNSPHQVSLNITLFIVYGCTQLAVEPRNLTLPEWEQLLTAFGLRVKPQFLFPLNLQQGSSVEGHILFPIRSEVHGKGVGGDIPEKREYLFEIEDLLTKTKSVVSASAVYALDKNYHQRTRLIRRAN